jgi:hypothetical protein
MTTDVEAGSIRRVLRRRIVLAVGRARARVTAYVYGNILVLAAVAGAGEQSIDSGSAVVLVLATAVTTYLAHVVALSVGSRLGRPDGPRSEHLRQELRDAAPIITSGLLPAALLLLGYLDVIASEWTQLLAAAWVVVRLAGIGIQVERVSGAPAPRSAFWSGVTLAVVSAVVVTLKVMFAH